MPATASRFSVVLNSNRFALIASLGLALNPVGSTSNFLLMLPVRSDSGDTTGLFFALTCGYCIDVNGRGLFVEVLCGKKKKKH